MIELFSLLSLLFFENRALFKRRCHYRAQRRWLYFKEKIRDVNFFGTSARSEVNFVFQQLRSKHFFNNLSIKGKKSTKASFLYSIIYSQK